MSRKTRRDFLKQTVAASGAMTLASQAVSAQEAVDAPLDMAVCRWKGASVEDEGVAEMARKLTVAAMDALGGMKRFVNQGDVVWVKPNIAWDRRPEQAATTNPAVVAALVELCYKAGAKNVKVGDHPCNEITKTYPRSGIEQAAKEAGAEVVYIDPSRFRETEIGGKGLKSIPVYTEITDCDLVINVPIAKHHSATTVTLCMKNYMGVVDNRAKFHQDLPTTITDISLFMKPRLCVLDAIRLLTANGPTGGNLADVKRADTVVAGTDIVALDAFGASLLGYNPQEIGTIVSGHNAGLGQIDYKKLRYKEIALA